MRALIIILVLGALLSGCATADLANMANMVVPPYVPVPIHIYDQAQYAADVAECSAAGTNWKPKFSIGTAISKTVDGATSNASLIPLNPLVPAAGAAGGALDAASDGLDVMSGQHRAVYQNCLRDETRRDRSAIVADPRE